MDIRVLRYYLVVAREERFSRGGGRAVPLPAHAVPSDSEDGGGSGRPAADAHHRNARLTRKDMRLRRRAQEIQDLMDKTKAEFTHREDEVSQALNKNRNYSVK